MKPFFWLGSAAHFSKLELWRHTFAFGTPFAAQKLRQTLAQKYSTNKNHVALTKNGRSALTIALEFALPKDSAVLVNGFTCYAVYEAVKAAGMTPVFADIDTQNYNFTAKTLKEALARYERKTANTKKHHPAIRGLIIQNTFGHPVDIKAITIFAKNHELKIIEDLAHCVGLKYANGREAGTIGVASALSFGKDKTIDTISGGAVILRDPCFPAIKAPSFPPHLMDSFRMRFYPLIGATYRTLTRLHLEKPYMAIMLALKFVERSADNKLSLRQRPPYFISRSALRQLNHPAKLPLRQTFLVKDRDRVLKKLRREGFFFDGFWYEKPVSPARYYKKVHFPEADCPVAVKVAEHIVNVPSHYPQKSLKPALEIIRKELL